MLPVKHPKRKTVFILLLTVLLLAGFIGILVLQNAFVIRTGASADAALKEEAISSAVEDIGLAWQETEARVEEIYRISAELSASALHGAAEEPEDQAANITVTVENNVNFQGIILRPEAVCGGYALLVMEDSASERGFHIVYKNDLISADTELDRAGLTWETIRQNAGSEKSTLTLKNTVYEYSVSEVPEMNGYLVMLVPKENLFVRSLSHSTYTIALVILLLFGVAVSGSSVPVYVQNNALTPNMEQKYQPRNVRRLVMLCGLIGAIMIAVCGWLDQSLNSLYDFSVRSRDVLNAAEKNIEMQIERDSRESQNVESIYLAYGSRIAEILNDQPEMRTGETLRSFADKIHASTITLYDSQGKETACSGDYIDLELGRDPLSATWEFRSILNGAPSIFREAETDEVTRLNEVRLGIRIDDPAEDGKYGAMIIGLDPSILEHDTGEEINRILGDMTSSGARLWISDLETGRILASGDRELIGKSIRDLGMSETDLKNALMREVRTDVGFCYVASAVLNDPDHQTAGETESGKGQITFYSENLDAADYGISSIAISCIVFLVMYAILQNLSLRDYTDEFYSTYKYIALRAGSRNGESSGSGGKQGNLSGLKLLIKRVSDQWSSLPPGKRGLLTIEAILVLFLVQQIPLVYVRKDYARDSVYYSIATGNWNKGLNLFALAAIVNLAAEILLGVLLTQLILNGIALLAGTKGKTICRLISSFVRYVALFIFLGMTFSYLGVDKTTIITSVGAISLALSLGAQDLISDVIAGVAIVFEGTFHVGDIVQISETTGKIMEIGIRCTKILERDGDIVTIANRQIGKIVNMTQHSSWYPCELTVSSSLDIEAIESMLQEELPKIREKNQRILSGPIYKGVTALGSGTMTLTVSTECVEDDYEEVKQMINRELQNLFREKGIQI